MDTKYIALEKNGDYIFINPNDSKNENNSIVEESDEKNITDSSLKLSPAAQEILHYSIQYKLRNSNNTKFKVLQKWEGIVEEFDGKTLQVRLIDLTNMGTDEEAELTLEDIPKDDVKLVKKGAMFYWNIGYETRRDGQVRKSSFVKFKRLPKINPVQFNLIQDKAVEIRNKLSFD